MSDTTDIGQLASEALTALTDPGAVGLDNPNEYGPLIAGHDRERRWSDNAAYATERLNAIISVTDPADDEDEITRCADSLDALGIAVARIRDQVAGPAPADDDEPDNVIGLMDRALDTLDEAIAGLRRIADDEENEGGCEDCAVNGDDCREHGEAFRVARQAVLDNPARVIALLTKEVQT